MYTHTKRAAVHNAIFMESVIRGVAGMSTGARASASDKLRADGNKRYQAAGAEGINPGLKRDRLRDAVSLYQRVSVHKLIM